MNTLKWVALIVVAVVLLLLVEKWGGSRSEWEHKLDSAVAVERAIAADHQAAYLLQRVEDSTKLATADAITRADSLRLADALRGRTVAVQSATVARRATDSAKAELARAGTLHDSVTAQTILIVVQEREIGRLADVIVADSNAIREAAKESLGLRAQLGITHQQRDHERTRADSAEAQRERLLALAGKRPHGFSLFGFKLELKPSLGYGLNYSPTTKRLDHGVQLHLSVFRG